MIFDIEVDGQTNLEKIISVTNEYMRKEKKDIERSLQKMGSLKEKLFIFFATMEDCFEYLGKVISKWKKK